MPPPIDRRDFLKAAAALPLLSACGDRGLAALDAAGDVLASPLDPKLSFAHGVASGDPLPDRVILWTRLSGATSATAVRWQVFRDVALTQLVSAGEFLTDAARDYTVKVDAMGLMPATSYYYQFEAGGQKSAAGRTRTAPAAGAATPRLRFAVASCAKYHKAYWHAYRHIAERADLDAVLHLGDYIYEEDDQAAAIPGRALVPNIEIYSLTEYRERHAFFKSDADLQAVHRQHPFICVWDDHEIADNCHREGAHRHFPDQHGSWADRRAAAVKAYDEWMPLRTQDPADLTRIYRNFVYGDLAELVMIDARLFGRSPEVASPVADSPRPANPTEINDESRSILGETQRDWFFARLKDSTARWKLVGNQVMFGQLDAVAGLQAAGGGQILNGDQWDGYRADQQRVLAHLRDNAINDVVILTGDIHSSWALDLTEDPHNPASYAPGAAGQLPPAVLRSLAVEFVCPGIGSEAGQELATIAMAAPAVNPHIRFVNGANRGYMLVDLDASRAQAEWYYVDAPESPTDRAITDGELWASGSGNNQLLISTARSAPKTNPPPLAA